MASADVAAEPETTLADLELSRSLSIQMAVVGSLGFAVALGVFGALYQASTGRTATVAFGPTGVGWWTEALSLLSLLVLSTAVVFPHEWLHGLAVRYYGGRPRYGVGLAHYVLPYAYTTTDHRFDRDQFLVVLLTPLVVLTLVGVPAMIVLEWSWLLLPLAANAGGAVGDCWMALTLLGYPSHVRVEDHRSGVRILGREGDRPRDLSVTAAVWDALVGAAAASAGLLVLLSFGGLFVLSALEVGSFAVGTPGTISFLFAFTNTPTEVSLTVGFGLPVVGGLIGLTYSFVRVFLRRGEPAVEPTD